MFLAGSFLFAGTTLFGLAAAKLVGRTPFAPPTRRNPGRCPLLAQYSAGGKGTWAATSCLDSSPRARRTILAVVSALTLSRPGDRPGLLRPLGQKRPGRRQAGRSGLPAVEAVVSACSRSTLGFRPQGVNTGRVLVILPSGVAASATLSSWHDPASTFWTNGLQPNGGGGGGMSVGLLSSVVLAMSGRRWRGADACGRRSIDRGVAAAGILRRGPGTVDVGARRRETRASALDAFLLAGDPE